MSTYDLGDDLDLIAPDEAIGADAFSMWLLAGTAERHPPGPAGDEGDEPKPKKKRKRKKKRKPKQEAEPAESPDDYPDLVEIDNLDLEELLAEAMIPNEPEEPDIVGIDFGLPEDEPDGDDEDDEDWDWETDYYGREEAEEEDDEDPLEDGYSTSRIEAFFGDDGGRSTPGPGRPKPSAQSKVRAVMRTPLASDYDDDDDYEDDEEDEGYVSLFEPDVSDRPFAVRALGPEVTHAMPTTVQRFLDGNVNLGGQVSALWRGFPAAYGIRIGRQRYAGFAMRPTRAILTGRDFGEAAHMSVARMLSFDRFVRALADGDPYAVEFLGIGRDNLLYADASAKTVLTYADAFMSKRIGQGALATVVELIQQIGRPADYDIQFGQDRRDRAIRAIDTAKEDFVDAYGRFAKIYVDVQNYQGSPTVMASLSLHDMPISEMSDFSSTLGDIARGYGMMADVRGRSSLRGEQLAYAMTEVVRILQTTSELLDGEGLHVLRDRKVHVLEGILRGRLIGPDGRPMREYWDIVDEEQMRLEDAMETTEMPDEPDERLVERLVASQNRRTILEDA